MKKILNFCFARFFVGFIFLFCTIFFCFISVCDQRELEIKTKECAERESNVGQIKNSEAKEARLSVTAVNRVKMPLSIYYLQEESSVIEPLIFYLTKAFQFSGQCVVIIKKVAEKPSKKTIKEFFGTESPLALFLLQGDKQKAESKSAEKESIREKNARDKHDQRIKNKQSIELYLFNTLEGNIIFQKKCWQGNVNRAGLAYRIADILWPVLTGQAAMFSSKIAYCKQVDLAHGKRAKHICMADFDGSNEQTVIDLPTVSVAPRWNNDVYNPLIFYSEYTNDNVRLMFVDMKKNRRIASNFDGISMLPAFSQDGKKVIYCASHGDGLCQLYYGVDGVFKKIVENKGNNLSPSFIDDTTILFCSDFQTGTPQIYLYNMITEVLERITPGGYCTSPSYSKTRNCIAYSKREKGEAQIYLYDMKKKTDTRLTSGKGSKQEPSWSPCGNYLVFSVESGNQSRIGLFNMVTKEISMVTPEGVSYSYPSWSPCYAIYPCL